MRGHGLKVGFTLCMWSYEKKLATLEATLTESITCTFVSRLQCEERIIIDACGARHDLLER